VVNDPTIDIVDINTPNDTHAEITLAAAKAGKAILCEKPLAMDVKQAKQMCDAVKKAGVVNMICHNYRRIPAIAHAKKMIDAGDLGAKVCQETRHDLHVADARQLVVEQVGIDVPAGLVVHDPFFGQRVGDPHDQRPEHLAPGGELVENQPAVLHADALMNADVSGLGVDRQVDHLHSPHLVGGQPVFLGALSLDHQGHLAQQAARLLPGADLLHLLEVD